MNKHIKRNSEMLDKALTEVSLSCNGGVSELQGIFKTLVAADKEKKGFAKGEVLTYNSYIN